MNASRHFDATKLFPLPPGISARVEPAQRAQAQQRARALLNIETDKRPLASQGNMSAFLALRSAKED